MYVCLCKGVTTSQIEGAVNSGAQSLADLQASLGVAENCGRCSDSAQQIIREMLEKSGNSLFYEVA